MMSKYTAEQVIESVLAYIEDLIQEYGESSKLEKLRKHVILIEKENKDE